MAGVKVFATALLLLQLLEAEATNYGDRILPEAAKADDQDSSEPDGSSNLDEGVEDQLTEAISSSLRSHSLGDTWRKLSPNDDSPVLASYDTGRVRSQIKGSVSPGIRTGHVGSRPRHSLSRYQRREQEAKHSYQDESRSRRDPPPLLWRNGSVTRQARANSSTEYHISSPQPSHSEGSSLASIPSPPGSTPGTGGRRDYDVFVLRDDDELSAGEIEEDMNDHWSYKYIEDENEPNNGAEQDTAELESVHDLSKNNVIESSGNTVREEGQEGVGSSAGRFRGPRRPTNQITQREHRLRNLPGEDSHHGEPSVARGNRNTAWKQAEGTRHTNEAEQNHEMNRSSTQYKIPQRSKSVIGQLGPQSDDHENTPSPDTNDEIESLSTPTMSAQVKEFDALPTRNTIHQVKTPVSVRPTPSLTPETAVREPDIVEAKNHVTNNTAAKFNDPQKVEFSVIEFKNIVDPLSSHRIESWFVNTTNNVGYISDAMDDGDYKIYEPFTLPSAPASESPAVNMDDNERPPAASQARQHSKENELRQLMRENLNFTGYWHAQAGEPRLEDYLQDRKINRAAHVVRPKDNVIDQHIFESAQDIIEKSAREEWQTKSFRTVRPVFSPVDGGGVVTVKGVTPQTVTAKAITTEPITAAVVTPWDVTPEGVIARTVTDGLITGDGVAHGVPRKPNWVTSPGQTPSSSFSYFNIGGLPVRPTPDEATGDVAKSSHSDGHFPHTSTAQSFFQTIAPLDSNWELNPEEINHNNPNVADKDEDQLLRGYLLDRGRHRFAIQNSNADSRGKESVPHGYRVLPQGDNAVQRNLQGRDDGFGGEEQEGKEDSSNYWDNSFFEDFDEFLKEHGINDETFGKREPSKSRLRHLGKTREDEPRSESSVNTDSRREDLSNQAGHLKNHENRSQQQKNRNQFPQQYNQADRRPQQQIQPFDGAQSHIFHNQGISQDVQSLEEPTGFPLLNRGTTRDIRPNQGPPRIIHPIQGPPRDIHPNQGPPRDIHPNQGPPRDINPNQGPPRDIHPNQGQPRDIHPNQGPPRDIHPNQGPPRDIHPNQGPPQNILPNQVPVRDINIDHGLSRNIHQNQGPLLDIHPNQGPPRDARRYQGLTHEIRPNQGYLRDPQQNQVQVREVRLNDVPRQGIRPNHEPLRNMNQIQSSFPKGAENSFPQQTVAKEVPDHGAGFTQERGPPQIFQLPREVPHLGVESTQERRPPERFQLSESHQGNPDAVHGHVDEELRIRNHRPLPPPSHVFNDEQIHGEDFPFPPVLKSFPPISQQPKEVQPQPLSLSPPYLFETNALTRPHPLPRPLHLTQRESSSPDNVLQEDHSPGTPFPLTQLSSPLPPQFHPTVKPQSLLVPHSLVNPRSPPPPHDLPVPPPSVATSQVFNSSHPSYVLEGFPDVNTIRDARNIPGIHGVSVEDKDNDFEKAPEIGVENRPFVDFDDFQGLSNLELRKKPGNTLKANGKPNNSPPQLKAQHQLLTTHIQPYIPSSLPTPVPPLRRPLSKPTPWPTSPSGSSPSSRSPPSHPPFSGRGRFQGTRPRAPRHPSGSTLRPVPSPQVVINDVPIGSTKESSGHSPAHISTPSGTVTTFSLGNTFQRNPGNGVINVPGKLHGNRQTVYHFVERPVIQENGGNQIRNEHKRHPGNQENTIPISNQEIIRPDAINPINRPLNFFSNDDSGRPLNRQPDITSHITQGISHDEETTGQRINKPQQHQLFTGPPIDHLRPPPVIFSTKENQDPLSMQPHRHDGNDNASGESSLFAEAKENENSIQNPQDGRLLAGHQHSQNSLQSLGFQHFNSPLRHPDSTQHSNRPAFPPPTFPLKRPRLSPQPPPPPRPQPNGFHLHSPPPHQRRPKVHAHVRIPPSTSLPLQTSSNKPRPRPSHIRNQRRPPVPQPIRINHHQPQPDILDKNQPPHTTQPPPHHHTFTSSDNGQFNNISPFDNNFESGGSHTGESFRFPSGNEIENDFKPMNDVSQPLPGTQGPQEPRMSESFAKMMKDVRYGVNGEPLDIWIPIVTKNGNGPLQPQSSSPIPSRRSYHATTDSEELDVRDDFPDHPEETFDFGDDFHHGDDADDLRIQSSPLESGSPNVSDDKSTEETRFTSQEHFVPGSVPGHTAVPSFYKGPRFNVADFPDVNVVTAENK